MWAKKPTPTETPVEQRISGGGMPPPLNESSAPTGGAAAAAPLQPNGSSASPSAVADNNARRIDGKPRNGDSCLFLVDEKFHGVAMFKAVSETLYPKYQDRLPENVRVNLYAYLQQSTVGPNLDPPPNCLLSFFSPPSINSKWQTWRNLANMPKAKAIKCFMEMYIDAEPDFQTSPTINERVVMDELRIQLIATIRGLALKRKMEKFVFLYSKFLKAVLKIQTTARTYIAKKSFLKKHSTLLQTEVGWLVDVLKLGIRVTKVAYNGGIPRIRFLWLEGDSYNLGNARLCVGAKLAKGVMKTKGLFIADVAEIRPNSSSYTFKLSGSKYDDSECLSIIGSERTIDLMFYKGEMYGKSRDWLVRTLNILVDKSIPAKELSSRGRVPGQLVSGALTRMSAGSLRDAEHMATLLSRGFGVKEYIVGGVTGSSSSLTTMWTVTLKGTGELRLVLATASPTVNSKGINCSDISEIRFGKASQAQDLNFPIRQSMVSIIGSETVLTVLFDDEALRSKFVKRMQCFLLNTKIKTGR